MLRERTRDDSEKSFRKQGMIVSKFLIELTGGRVHGYAIAGGQYAKNTRGRIADEHGILHGHMHVVKNHGNKALRKRGGFHGGSGLGRGTTARLPGRCEWKGVRPRRLHGKRSDGLQFPAVVELKILLLQVLDHFAVRIAHHDAYQHVVDAHFKGCGSVLAGNFLDVLLGTGNGRFGSGIGTSGRRGSLRWRSGRRWVLGEDSGDKDEPAAGQNGEGRSR